MKTKPVYVQSAEMFQDIFTSLQHHGRAEVILDTAQEKSNTTYRCLDCQCELLPDELELERCKLCHEIAEPDHPSPEDVYGKEDLI